MIQPVVWFLIGCAAAAAIARIAHYPWWAWAVPCGLFVIVVAIMLAIPWGDPR